MRARLALALLVAACAAPRPSPGGAAPPSTRRVPLGLCEDYPEETRSLVEVRRDLDLVRAAGLQALRVSVGWDGVEPERGRYDLAFLDQLVNAADERGVRLLPYVAYTPPWNAGGPPEDRWRQPPRDRAAFGALMERLARRYRGRIRSWELWNEPDNRDYWRGTPAEYAALLREGSAGVRRGDPDAQVVAGGLAGGVPFLRAALAEPGTAGAVDVINAHAYFETWNGAPLEQLDPYLDEVAGLAGGRPLWLAEVGYSAFRRGAVVSAGVRARYAYEHTPAFQAVALVRTLALALARPDVALVAWYELKDPPASAPVIGDDNNRHLGVATAEYAPRPALAALTFLARLVRPGVAPLRGLAVHGEGVTARGMVVGDGSALVIAWLPTRGPGISAEGDGELPDERRVAMEVELPCPAATSARRLDELGRPGPPPPLRRAGDRTRDRTGDDVWLGPVEVRGGEVAVLTVDRCRPEPWPPRRGDRLGAQGVNTSRVGTGAKVAGGSTRATPAGK
jgi:hypothetical protein